MTPSSDRAGDVRFEWRSAVADDLLSLSRLHRTELDAPTLSVLRAQSWPDGLGLRLTSPAGQTALTGLRAAVMAGPDEPEPAELEVLAADFAAIYLNHALGASPEESVWRDPDHLARQQPMFAVREWYRQHGVVAGDWRCCPDDHLSLELAFVAHLLSGASEAGLGAAAGFLDQHPLRWVGAFARRVAERSDSPFYASLALLTWAYLEELRELLAAGFDLPRPEPVAEAAPPPVEPAPASYLPGCGPVL